MLPEAAVASHPAGGGAHVVGITGAPGAGKSTLTSSLVGALREEDLRVGVLAIDPSSPFSGGAILGDRVRMGDHTLDDGVYIRSMATRGHLGGLALATPEAARVLAVRHAERVARLSNRPAGEAWRTTRDWSAHRQNSIKRMKLLSK